MKTGIIKINPRNFIPVISYVIETLDNGKNRYSSIDVYERQHKYAFANLGKKVKFETKLSKKYDYEYGVILKPKNKRK